jgi:hypothetical protein
MKLKHIQLFEAFNADSNISFDELIFDWMPFDDMSSDPMQSNIPETLKYSELGPWIKEAIATGQLKNISKAGLFISHKKNSDGGFTRFIANSLTPLSFNMSNWNRQYEKTNEIPNINPEEVDLGDLAKGASLLARFGG